MDGFQTITTPYRPIRTRFSLFSNIYIFFYGFDPKKNKKKKCKNQQFLIFYIKNTIYSLKKIGECYNQLRLDE